MDVRGGMALKGHVSNGNGTRRLAVQLAIGDFPMLRAGFGAVLANQPDLEVVGDAQQAAGADEAGRIGADVVVVEVHQANGESAGFEPVERLRRADPGVRIIAIDCRTARSDQFSAALKAGADGFLTREAAPDDVLAAVRTVSRGQTYVSPAIVSRMVNTYVLGARETPEDNYASLNDREREVLLLAAVGHTNREIAGKLGLPEGRVHHYRATVMEKLGLHDRVELLKYAIRHGVLGVADV